MGERVRHWLRDRRAQLVGTLPVIVFFIALFWVVQLGFGDRYLLAVSPFTTLFETRLEKYNPPSQYARFFLVSALALVGARLAVTNVALCVAVNLAMPFALVFMRSSQLNPRRYFPYTMLFAFLQLRPENLVTAFATQAAVLAACCVVLSAGLLLAGAVRHRAREARGRLHDRVAAWPTPSPARRSAASTRTCASICSPCAASSPHSPTPRARTPPRRRAP